MKIPFAIRLQDRQLVEIGQVPSGKECECVCPSCQQGVLGRQGEIKCWHFAHDPHSPYAPEKNCDISFYSCCRAFVISRLLAGAVRVIQTPGGRLLALDKVEDPHPYDLVAHVRGTKLYIHLAYEGRPLPKIPEEGKDCLLLVDLTFIGEGFKVRTPSAQLLADLVIELFEADMQHKRWLYHPLFPELSLNRRPTQEAPAAKDILLKPEISLPNGNYICDKCGQKWTGKQHQDAMCAACHTPLYSRFFKDNIR